MKIKFEVWFWFCGTELFNTQTSVDFFFKNVGSMLGITKHYYASYYEVFSVVLSMSCFSYRIGSPGIISLTNEWLAYYFQSVSICFLYFLASRSFFCTESTGAAINIY